MCAEGSVPSFTVGSILPRVSPSGITASSSLDSRCSASELGVYKPPWVVVAMAVFLLRFPLP